MHVVHKKKNINLIQNVATPHNNVLIGAFKQYSNVNLKLWYEKSQNKEKYQWVTDITHEHFPAEIYGTSINWKFIKYCLSHRDEIFVIVGWGNINTQLLHLLFFFLRRPFNHWSDLPNTDPRTFGIKKRIKRWFSYKILCHSKAKIFCVGRLTIDYFKKCGFSNAQLVNLPIFVETDEDISVYHSRQREVLSRYSIEDSDFVLTAGSRIVYEKGYDLLVKAISLLDKEVREHVKVLIVGSGPCKSNLEKIIKELRLEKQVVLENWLSIEEFKTVIANSHVFSHPARIDSYGGTTLGMALGVPVIGSYGAGAAVDRIEQGRNGFLYQPEDIHSLASLITILYRYPELRKHMGREARKTAESWPPKRGVEILMNNAI